MTYEYKQYLAHHGIKGQKWGVRRYQNEDGTLTAEGKKRYRKEVCQKLKKLSKMSSKQKDTRLSDALKADIPEEVLSRHRKSFNKYFDEYDRLSKAATKREITDKEYEKFTEKYETPYYQEVLKEARDVLGKYSSKKLTEIHSSVFHYKLKMRADHIIRKAINNRLFEERYAKQMVNNQEKTMRGS